MEAPYLELPTVAPANVAGMTLAYIRDIACGIDHAGGLTSMDPNLKHVLIPMDFGPEADAALDYAKVLADRFGAQVHLLHVVEDLFAYDMWAPERWPEIASIRTRLLADAERRLACRLTAGERARLRATTHLVAGRPAEHIVRLAADRGMDLIVMGTHGRTGITHVLMGSVAESVIRTAPCPVLTVRDRPVAESISVPAAEMNTAAA